MKRVIGILCCASFILTSAACLIGSEFINLAKDHQSITVDHSYVEQDRPGRQSQAQTKAATLEIVWTEHCGPCRRLKVVAIRLVAEGYDIVLVNADQDTRGSSVYPSLYYLDSNGGFLRKETGFKTAAHIKEHLDK